MPWEFGISITTGSIFADLEKRIRQVNKHTL